MFCHNLSGHTQDNKHQIRYIINNTAPAIEQAYLGLHHCMLMQIYVKPTIPVGNLANLLIISCNIHYICITEIILMHFAGTNVSLTVSGVLLTCRIDSSLLNLKLI